MIEYICSFEEEYGFLVSESMKYGEELIRCKDCTYYRGDHEYCVNDMFAIESGFCMWAERKEQWRN